MSLSVKVDWARDGFGIATPDDVTALVRGAVSFEYGRDQSTALAPVVAGRGSMVLDNRDKRFSPRNTSSPLYGLVKPSRPVKITRTISGTDYVLFGGHTDDNPINPDTNAKTVTISLVDALADLRGQEITTGLYSSIRTGDAINYVLDACGWPAELRDIDPGATVIPWWWEDGTDALNAIEKIVQSEGPPALLTQGSDGSIAYRDRHHRLTRTRSLTSQATFRGVASTTQPYMLAPFSYDEAWRNIINTATVNVDVRAPQEIQSVFQSEGKLILTAGEQRMITVTSSDPFRQAQPLAVDTDYVLISGSVVAEVIKDSGTSAAIKLTAGGAGAVIEGLQLRAQPVTVINTVQVSADDAQSIADFGRRSFPTDLPWCNPADAEAVIRLAVALRSQPLPIIQATFLCRPAVPAATILGLDLSDRVTIHEDETSLDGVDFFIESITHELTSELDHRVTFGLEMVPNQETGSVFRFDTAGQGFNDGLFGNGIDEPDLVFQFDNDTAGHRFDEGSFAN